MFKNKFMIALIVVFAFRLGGETACATEETQESYNGINPEPVVLPSDVEDGVMSNPDAPQKSEQSPAVDNQYFECDTGQKWTTINGETKMLDGNGNPVGYGENYLVIDVSQYQGKIDWQEVKDGGVDGVIIRATSYAGGDIHEDDYFAENIKGAMKVGLPVGVYVYSYAESPSEALYEANVLLDILNDNNIEPSDLDLGVYYDLEGNDYTSWMGPEEYEPIASTFMGQMESNGYSTSLYSYTSYLNNNLDSQYLHYNTTWVAQYGPELKFNSEYSKPGITGWQYQSDGNIPGVNGNCDVNCFWINPGESITGEITDYQVEGDRLGVLADGELYVKDNGMLTPYIKVSTNVADFQLEGNRIGVLKEDGTLYVKEGSLNEPWVKETTDVSSFYLEGNRIGALKDDGTLYVKEGSLSSAWVKETTNVSSFQLEGNRIGALKDDGTLCVKEGSLTSVWVKETTNVSDFQLEGNRIGVLKKDGTLFVKEGSLSAGWISETTNVSSFQLEGNRIGALKKDGTLCVKEGSLSAGWVKEASNVSSFQLEGDRIGILKKDETLHVKEGGLDAGWVKETSGVENFQLEGNIIAIESNNGMLYLKDGSLYAPWYNMNYGVS